MQTYEPSWWRVIAASSARALLVLVCSLTAVSVLTAVLGWTPTVVLTGSMEPALPVGSVLVTQELPADELELGQVLTVEDPDQPGKLRSHRLVEFTPDGDLILRGDANADDDSTPVATSAVRGVGTLAVPLVGLPVAWWVAGQYAHLLAAALLLGLALALRRADRVPATDAAARRPRLRGLRGWRRAGAATATLTAVAGLVLAAPGVDSSYAAFTKATQNPTSGFSAAAVLRAYRAAVLADSPYLYWRLNETSGTAAADSSTNGTRVGTYAGTYTRNQTSPITGEADNRAVSFTAGYVSQNATVTSPSTFSIEAWIKSSSTAGGRILGFGNGTGGAQSTTEDRQLYLSTAGKVVFGMGTTTKTYVTSPASYNNNAWHHVVATYTSGGLMRLYVDGAQVAVSSANVAAPTAYTGIWRAAAENISEWTNGGTSNTLNAQLDELAVYTTALSAARVTAHYNARTQ